MKIRALFLDIGSVLLTDGWSHVSRQAAAQQFGLDWDEMEARHKLIFERFERGGCTLEEYLNAVVFYQERAFTHKEFQEFMFAQSKPYPEMIDLMQQLKSKYRLKIGVISNESRELNAYRIEKFKLKDLVDYFISSCYVGMRKPDQRMYRLALDIGQINPTEVIYIDDRSVFVDLAKEFGIQGICHKDLISTSKELQTYGLQICRV